MKDLVAINEHESDYAKVMAIDKYKTGHEGPCGHK